MKVSIVQMKISDNLENNLKNILSFIEKAHFEDTNIICFPEMSLTGYNLDLLKDAKMNQRVDELLKPIKDKCDRLGIAAIVGHPYKHNDKLFNRATVILPCLGSLFYDKKYPTETELKIFDAGDKLLTFEYCGKRFGIAICRDQNYYELFKGYKEQSCDGVFILAAHFYNPKEARWKVDKNRAIPITRACENSYYIFLSNTTGPHLGMISLGHSLIVDGNGYVIVEGDEVTECLLSYEL